MSMGEKMEGDIHCSVANTLHDLMTANREDKTDTEGNHWKLLKNWRTDNVRYKCLRVQQGYSFKGEDEHGFFKSMVRECLEFFDRKVNDSRSQGGEVQ